MNINDKKYKNNIRMKLQDFLKFQYFGMLILITFLILPSLGHDCNITDTINRGCFYLSRCTFIQT